MNNRDRIEAKGGEEMDDGERGKGSVEMGSKLDGLAAKRYLTQTPLPKLEQKQQNLHSQRRLHI